MSIASDIDHNPEISKTLDRAYDALTAAGYTVRAQNPGPGLCIVGVAPDSGGASTEPGSPWDEECESRIDDVRDAVSGLDVVVDWSDDDVHIDAVTE